MANKMIKIEVAYALPEKQFLYAFEVVQGTNALQAVELSPLFKEFASLDTSSLGVFSKPVTGDYILEEGDRVEIYRPLKADPKERRRKVAASEA